jgi:hypothetical protein
VCYNAKSKKPKAKIIRTARISPRVSRWFMVLDGESMTRGKFRRFFGCDLDKLGTACRFALKRCPEEWESVNTKPACPGAKLL